MQGSGIGDGVRGAWRLVTGCLGALVTSVVLMAGGGALAWWGMGVLENARASRDWPKVEGRITYSEVRVSSDSEGGDSYSPEVAYAYTVGAQAYVARRIAFGETSFGSRSRAEAITARYPVGRRVDVYYEPANPANAVLEPGVTLGSYLALAFGAAVGAGGVLTTPFWALRRLRRR